MQAELPKWYMLKWAVFSLFCMFDAVQGGKKLEAGQMNWLHGNVDMPWVPNKCSWQAGLALRRLVDLKDVLCGTKDDTKANLYA